jgi:tetratricopeptide (TPR) repeat protein
MISLPIVLATSMRAPAIYADQRSIDNHSKGSGDLNVKGTEEAIASADEAELNLLEVKIARVIQTNPSDVAANYLMSTLLLRMFTLDPGSYSLIRQSTELATQTYDLSNKGDFGITALANILEVSGESERGLALLAEAERLGMHLGWRADLARARLLVDASSGDDANSILKVLDHVLSDPDASTALVAPTLVAVISSKYERHSGASQIQELQAWSQRCPSVQMSLAVANANALSMNYDAAFEGYSLVLTLSPNNTEALIGQGIIAMQQKQDISRAIQSFRQAVAKATRPTEASTAKIHLALALIEQNKAPAATNSAAIDAIRSTQDQESVLLAILAAYRRSSTIASTLGFLKELGDAVPGMHLGHALMAELLGEKLHRYDEATASFTNAITLDPSRSEYFNGRGLAWMGLSNLEFALRDFESATAINPDDASARYNLACAQARLGRKEDALASLGKSLALDQRLQSLAKSDEDFLSIRSETQFNALVNADLNSGKGTQEDPISLAH